MKIFSKELKLTEAEKQYESVILKLLAHEKTEKKVKITLSDTICLLINEEKHFRVKVDNVGILIQNTTFSTKERHRDKVCSHLKSLIINSMNEDTEKELKEMDNKEKHLIESINNLL